ncbi:MAG: stage II sporulation protein P [Clostridia bacterium]|nr:stage II sporulation protein P [Clostridia bacterium]
MKFKGIMLIFCVLLASVYTTAHCFLKYVNYSMPISNSNTNFLPIEPLSDNIDTSSTISATDNTSSSSNNKDTQSTTVSASGQAVGNITAKFISPYTAGTKYNKVYLKNNTGSTINIKTLLEKKLSFKIDKNNKPQVLIMHTHTTESFMLEERDYYTEDDASRTRDSKKNMIAIGDIIEQKLKAAGIGVIHDTTIHDYPAYSGSYTRSAATITDDLKAYPSIKIVIDIHRDSITANNKEKIKPVVKIDGKNAAQVMLVMGSQTGGITNYPNWKENLSLALKYQQTLEVMYPGLARAITLNSGKYNQNLTKGSILLEVGTEANTLDEAKRGAAYAGEALVSLLNTLK